MMHIVGILAAGCVALAVLVASTLLLAIPAMAAAWVGHRRDLRRDSSTTREVPSVTPADRSTEKVGTTTYRDLRLAA